MAILAPGITANPVIRIFSKTTMVKPTCFSRATTTGVKTGTFPTSKSNGMNRGHTSKSSVELMKTNQNLFIFVLIWTGVLLGQIQELGAQNKMEQLKSTKGLVAFWDFKEEAGQARQAWGKGTFPLAEMDGTIPRLNEGPLSGYSAQFGSGAYLSLSSAQTGALNIYGPKQGVTVLAWVKWTGEQTGFIGGLWNEYQDGGKRQYGLFVSLPHYNGKNQVCGHISLTGKPTPPIPLLHRLLREQTGSPCQSMGLYRLYLRWTLHEVLCKRRF